jgi:Protein of unknown function (DUF3014)
MARGPDDLTQRDLPPSTSLKRPARWPWVVGLLLLLALPAGLYLATHRPEAEPAVQQLDAGATALSAAEDAGPARSLVDGAALLRRLLGALGAPPALLSWLEGDDLLRRLVAAVNLIAEGQSPRAMLTFLPVEGGFQARELLGPMPPRPRKGPPPPRPVRYFIAQASFQRYEGVAAALGAVDATAAGGVYGELRPFLDAAYAEIGRPGTHFDDALARALGQLLAVRFPAGDLELQARGAVWILADPTLEALAPAQKHLLRMGPQYGGAVQRQLRAFAQGAGIVPR